MLNAHSLRAFPRKANGLLASLDIGQLQESLSDFLHHSSIQGSVSTSQYVLCTLILQQYVFCMHINLTVLNSTHTAHPEVTGSGSGVAEISTP
jgi:hypothetical protein